MTFYQLGCQRFYIKKYCIAPLDTALHCILLVHFQVKTNLLRKAYSYDKQHIDEDNLPPPLKKWTNSAKDLTGNVSPILSP